MFLINKLIIVVVISHDSQACSQKFLLGDSFGQNIDIIHGTGLETNHVRLLVKYILRCAMRVAVEAIC